jgi:hypothetical protein
MKTVKIYLHSGNIITVENCGGIKAEFQYIPQTGNTVISKLEWMSPLPLIIVRSISTNRIEAIIEEDQS